MISASTCLRTPDSLGATSGLKTLPCSFIRVPFSTRPLAPLRPRSDRLVMPRFSRDTDELRTWLMDIRAVLTDNPIRDRLEPGDGEALRRAMGPHPPRNDAYWAPFMEIPDVRNAAESPVPAPAS